MKCEISRKYIEEFWHTSVIFSLLYNCSAEHKKSHKRSSYDLIVKPPDGGYGWVIVMSSFLLQAVGGGVAFSFGVFFVEFLLAFNQGKGTTAWIGSINTGLLFGAGKTNLTILGKQRRD